MHSSHFRIPAVTAAVLLASGISGAASAANVELYGSIDNGLRVTAARGIDGASSQTTVGMESGQWIRVAWERLLGRVQPGKPL